MKWGGDGCSLSLHDAALSDMVPAKAQFLLFGRWINWVSFWRWQARRDAIIAAAVPLRSISSSRLCFFPLIATLIVCSVVISAAAALKLLFWSDTVPRWLGVTANHHHQGLLYKLTILNFSSYLLKTISSYLDCRTFQTSLQSATSTYRGMWAEVAHGGLVSPPPALFSLYVNGMPTPSSHVNKVKYADDTAPVAMHRSPLLVG
jgi:hypothetical protein